MTREPPGGQCRGGKHGAQLGSWHPIQTGLDLDAPHGLLDALEKGPVLGVLVALPAGAHVGEGAHVGVEILFTYWLLEDRTRLASPARGGPGVSEMVGPQGTRPHPPSTDSPALRHPGGLAVDLQRLGRPGTMWQQPTRAPSGLLAAHHVWKADVGKTLDKGLAQARQLQKQGFILLLDELVLLLNGLQALLHGGDLH